jgi:hypothetical protein
VVPAFASERPSHEFVQYLRCRQAHIASCEGEPEALFEDPEYEKWEAKQADACEALSRTCDVIRNRPVRSERDFKELIRVVQEELWQQRPDGSWVQHSCNDELESALQRALFQRIEGGANV